MLITRQTLLCFLARFSPASSHCFCISHSVSKRAARSLTFKCRIDSPGQLTEGGRHFMAVSKQPFSGDQVRFDKQNIGRIEVALAISPLLSGASAAQASTRSEESGYPRAIDHQLSYTCDWQLLRLLCLLGKTNTTQMSKHGLSHSRNDVIMILEG